MRELLGRTLHGMALTLESAEGAEKRMLRVLELLRRLVPYERCALLAAPPGRPSLLLVEPTPSPEARGTLSQRVHGLLAQLVDERALPVEARQGQVGSHLAVPLVGNDKAIGVLFVDGASVDGSTTYTSQHLRELSVVGSLLAGFLMMVEQTRTLDQARLEAEAANRTKDELVALISHELKTPLTSTLQLARTVGWEARPSARIRAANAIERNVEGMTKLIDEVLEVAHIATSGLRLELQPIEPAKLIRAAIQDQRARAERRSIQVETTLDESVHLLVVDSVRMAQVISSLLAKAIHFTPDRGRVGVRVERAGTYARIRVIDHGKGFPPDALPGTLVETGGIVSLARLAGIPPGVLTQVLEHFATAYEPVACAFGELAVGLAVVKTLVEAHGGTLHAHSSADAPGSTFTIELPLPRDPRLGERLLAGIRVLIVEDNEDLRNATSDLLEKQGAEVTAVGSAAAALEALDRSKPHVLLSDLSIPGGSGDELLREAMAREATLPAVALTTLPTEEDRKRALAAGIRMHIARPLDANGLVAAVAALAGRPIMKDVAASSG